jgi:hypothetical protein
VTVKLYCVCELTCDVRRTVAYCVCELTCDVRRTVAYCVCELTGTMCVGLWLFSRIDILNSQNMKSIYLPVKPKDRKAEH